MSNAFEVGDGAIAEQIDLDAIDHVLLNDYNAMYEILNDNDIRVRLKLR